MSEYDDKFILLEYCQKNFGRMNIINKKVKEQLGTHLSAYTLNKIVEEGLMTRNKNDGNEYILTEDGKRFIKRHYTEVINEKELSRELMVSSIKASEATTKLSKSVKLTNWLVVIFSGLSLLIASGSLFVSYLALVREPPPPLQLPSPQEIEPNQYQNTR